MKLTFSKSYLSVTAFPDIELPPFVIVTGLNGAGKSHLLKAIELGHIVADVAPTPQDHVRYFDWNNMIPRDQGAYDGHALVQATFNLREQFISLLPAHIERLTQALRALGISGAYLSDPIETAALNDLELAAILPDASKLGSAKEAITSAATKVTNRIKSALPNNEARDLLDALAAQANVPIIALKPHHFSETLVPVWGRADAFQQSFGQLFVSYRNLFLLNELKLRSIEKTGRTDVQALSRDEFTKVHGEPPWEFVNRSVTAAALDFEIDHPDEFGLGPYQPKLIKRSNGKQITFEALSSGERILMSFALCLYYAEDRRQLASYPKLLLLDEIDAPLHPSMSRRLIDIIQHVLVEKHHICVMLATHSISTVALAPDDAICALEPGKQGLQKVSKPRALNILTVGVPTLALNYEGRRQVYVESPIDAKIYDRAYQILKPHLNSERSLEFMATGAASAASGSHENTGCTNVLRMVDDLAKSGNTSVFGLIDWDGMRNGTDRVVVLAHGRRDGLENVLLDPLLVAAVIARSDAVTARKIGVREDYVSFLKLPRSRLQEIIDEVQKLSMGPQIGALSTVTYLNGMALQLRNDYLKIDDHGLEQKILHAFPSLNAITKGKTGNLMLYVCENVLRECPGFAPMELMAALSDLLEKPSHVD